MKDDKRRFLLDFYFGECYKYLTFRKLAANLNVSEPVESNYTQAIQWQRTYLNQGPKCYSSASNNKYDSRRNIRLVGCQSKLVLNLRSLQMP